MRFALLGETLPAQAANALLCSECGMCEQYACIMELSPRRVNRLFKEKLSADGIAWHRGEKTPEPHTMREFRQVPSGRIIARNRLSKYRKKATFLAMEDDLFSKRVIPLQQHAGQPALPAVKTGDPVQRGDMIGTIPAGQVGATVHASLSGTVREVDEEYIEISS
jgi:Na+-translocating ferredoxin:NAD+ oxidoreductase RnfC subunit